MKPEKIDPQLLRLIKDSQHFGETPEQCFPMGALPPTGMEWQINQTAASIAFVNQAEQLILALQEQIQEVKDGKKTLTQWFDFVGFLKIQGIE